MTLNEAIAGQFHSTLKMLAQAIELCPEPLWLAASGQSPNRTWHLAYHALFYIHFYLSPSDSDFVAWQHHRPDYNFLVGIPWKPGFKPQIDQPYTQAELLAYAEFVHAEIDRRTADFNPDAPSGFSWLPFNQLGVHLYNLRHAAHHTGQLIERLRVEAGIGVPWNL